MLDAFDRAIHAWSSVKPADAHSVFDLIDRCGRVADASTNLKVYNVDAADPYDFRIEPPRHNVDMRAKWTRRGEYADAI